MSENRTIEEFVEDLLSDGRTPREVVAVARCTHWESQVSQIKEILRKHRNYKKRIEL